MNVRCSVQQGCLRLILDGENALERSRHRAVKRQARLRSTAGRCRLDLAAVEFIDSNGLGTLVSLSKAAAAWASGPVTSAYTRSVHVIQMIQLDEIFEIYPDSPRPSGPGRSADRDERVTRRWTT